LKGATPFPCTLIMKLPTLNGKEPFCLTQLRKVE
jgi:hypothetical protein